MRAACAAGKNATMQAVITRFAGGPGDEGGSRAGTGGEYERKARLAYELHYLRVRRSRPGCTGIRWLPIHDSGVSDGIAGRGEVAGSMV